MRTDEPLPEDNAQDWTAVAPVGVGLQSNFERLAAIDVGTKIEKKGNLSYLSWAWAVDQLLRADPTATWEYREYEGRPVLIMADMTAMVFCTVTAFGMRRTMQLPVMDHRNKAITNPDAFAINTAMQRCLVKAIALHGLGLYIYAGEDVPEGAKPNTGAQVCADEFDAAPSDVKDWLQSIAYDVQTMCGKNDAEGAFLHLEAQKLDSDNKLALWSLLDSKTRSAIKKAGEAKKHEPA